MSNTHKHQQGTGLPSRVYFPSINLRVFLVSLWHDNSWVMCELDHSQSCADKSRTLEVVVEVLRPHTWLLCSRVAVACPSLLLREVPLFCGLVFFRVFSALKWTSFSFHLHIYFWINSVHLDMYFWINSECLHTQFYINSVCLHEHFWINSVHLHVYFCINMLCCQWLGHRVGHFSWDRAAV